MNCPCVGDHVPNPKVLHRHHIVPKAWGGTDDTPPMRDAVDLALVKPNLVMLCPTAHENVHRLLNEYVRSLAAPDWEIRRRYTHNERLLAGAAWSWWAEEHGPVKPPWTLGEGAELDLVHEH